MNERHLALCSSAEWGDAVKRWIVPWALEDVDLGDDVLEIGPGPGLTTDALAAFVPNLTAVELDEDLAAALAERTAGTNVDVVHADASATGLASEQFSGAVSLTMLHHVPGVQAQDAVFAEVLRLLRPGGVLAGSDSVDGADFRDLHEGDVCVPLDPGTLAARLERLGYADVAVDTNEWAVRFRARRPR